VQLADVDLYSPDSFVDAVPHDMLATLRREAPVYAHPRPDGSTFWCITKHEDLVTVNRDAHLFSSYAGGVITLDPLPDEALASMRMMMLNMDPPEHTKLRKIVNKGFTPRRIRELQEVLVQRATLIVDEIVERGECEFVKDVACELPLQAIAEFLGVPQEDRHLVFDWSNRMIGSEDPDFATTPEESQAAAMELYAYSDQLAEDRRKNPRDDIVTALINADVDGEALTQLDFNLFFLLLAVAGNETTRNAISQGMLAFMEHPDQYERLIKDPSLIDTAVEEILRWSTPVMHFRRTAMADVEMRGETIKAGDDVVIWHMSANRDEDVFDEPYTFDIGREHNPHTMHVAFGGGGPHFCLGANLARAEIKVMFNELVTRVPDMELAGPPRRLRSNFINGLKDMPVKFSA
jgi:cholest-4-en-3-one 26-monooxygenase